MDELIPYQPRLIDGQTIPTVDGRDIYTFLGITKPYSNWMRGQIKRLHLVENRDYIVYTPKGVNPQGGRPSHEYFVSFDAAKHLAMASKTAKGHEVREYFIAKEQELAQMRQESLPPGGVPLVKNRALQAIITMAVELDAVREEARLAANQAERAESKADMAIAEAVQHLTLETFVLSNGLLRQMPRSYWRRYATWLKNFCLTYNLKTHPELVPGKPWDEEMKYPLPALGALLRYVERAPHQFTLLREEPPLEGEIA